MGERKGPPVRDPRPDPRHPRSREPRAAGGGLSLWAYGPLLKKSEFAGRGSERAERGGWEWGAGGVVIDAGFQ